MRVHRLRRKRTTLDEVANLIPKVREGGEPPKTDVLSLDSFVCDLCKGIIERAGLVQCGFCGRWICRSNCWSTVYLACLACSGLIKIWKESSSIQPPPETGDAKTRLADFTSWVEEKVRQLTKSIGLARSRSPTLQTG